MYIEDVENTDEVLLPYGDHFFFTFRMEGLGDGVSFTPPDNLPLDLGCTPAIETSTSKITRRMHCKFNARNQLFDCPEH